MNTLLKRTELALSGLSVLAVIAVMLIVTADTFMRYVLHAPFPWSFELISYYLLIAAVHFAVSDTFREGDHIGVDLLPQSVPRKVRLVMEMVWVVAAAVVFGIMSWGDLHPLWRTPQQARYDPSGGDGWRVFDGHSRMSSRPRRCVW
jgi:TRAP-type C4-dicarboxylate transport system permease small subunit